MMDELVLINSSRSLQTESVIRFVVSLYLILQMCVRILQNLHSWNQIFIFKTLQKPV